MLTNEQLAGLERLHVSPSARAMLDEIWRLRLVAIKADDLMRAQAYSGQSMLQSVEMQAVGLREALGLPAASEAIAETDKPREKGIWEYCRQYTAAHTAAEKKLKRVLIPSEFGAISDQVRNQS